MTQVSLKSFHNSSNSVYSQNSFLCYPKEACCTPYRRIHSKRNLVQSKLPSFLRAEASPSAHTSAASCSESPSVCRLRESPFSEPNQTEVLLSIGQQALTRGELLNLRRGNDLSLNLVDALFEVLKNLNKFLLERDETHPRVLLTTTAFARGVFQSQPQRADVNIFKYE